MKKFLNSKWILVILPLIVIIISMGIIISFQGIFFFHANKDNASYERLKKNDNYEEVQIEMKNGKSICGWLKRNKNVEKAPTVIFYMGNAENSSSVLNYFDEVGIIQYFEDFNLLIMDYPGYGKSEGFVNKDKTFLNFGTEVYDWIESQDYVDKNNIFVLGYSIGTGVSTYVASVRNVNGLILVAPYDEALSLYNDTINIFHGPFEGIAKFKIKAKEYAKNVDIPVLVFASKDDEVIKYDFSKNLVQYFNEVEEFVTFEDIKHSHYFSQYEFWEKLQNYIYGRISNEV